MAELNLAVRTSAMRLPFRRSLEMAARLGVSAVELDARNEIHPSQLSDTGMRQLRKMLDDLNLKVAALRFQTRRGYDNPQELDRRVDATKDAMDLAYRLGTTAVINSIGSVPEDEDDPRAELLHGVLEDLGRHGAKVGAFLAAETGSESGVTLAKALERAEAGYVAVAFNPGQLIINRHDVREAASALRKRVSVLCAIDGVLDLAAGRGIAVPLGQGTTDFPVLLGVLEEAEFRGPVIVGRRDSTLEELRQGVEYLKNL